MLLDSLGTLLGMEPPAPRLRAELRRRAGVELDEERVAAAFAAEIAFYLEHHLEGRDAESLERLRDRCAEVLHRELRAPGVPPATVRAAMLAAIRFRPYPDAAPALRELRRRGLRLVVASNWDCSLAGVLADTELGPLLDAVVTSATVGADKPSPLLFRAALDAAGCAAAEAIHVGDSPNGDVRGAAAAGIRAVLLDRGGAAVAPAATELARIARLDELPALADGLR